MDRERWKPYPAATEAEVEFLARLVGPGSRAERDVTVVSTGGRRSRLRASLHVEAEEPLGGESAVVCRLELERPLDDDESVTENLWEVAEAFLREREEAALQEAAQLETTRSPGESAGP